MSGRLRVTGASLRYPDAPGAALSGVDLDLPGDALVSVVGPSGSGKSSLLRLVAGLERPSPGTVAVDGIDITTVPAGRRPTAMVFQEETLFPERTVAENVEYGLLLHDVPAARRRERLEVALLQFGLVAVADQLPHRLSGGQARRVALARAWVLRPSVLLLDEPLAGLDARLRRRLLDLVVRTQRRLGGTVLHVTHDLEEALSTSDVVVVLDGGRIRQVGPPREVYTRPADAFVADLTGPAGLLAVDVTPTREAALARVHLWGSDRLVPAHPEAARGPHRGTLVVRPHAVTLEPLPPTRARPEIRGAVGLVQEARYVGERWEYAIETDAGIAVATGPVTGPIALDDHVLLEVADDATWLLPPPGPRGPRRPPR